MKRRSSVNRAILSDKHRGIEFIKNERLSNSSDNIKKEIFEERRKSHQGSEESDSDFDETFDFIEVSFRDNIKSLIDFSKTFQIPRKFKNMANTLDKSFAFKAIPEFSGKSEELYRFTNICDSINKKLIEEEDKEDLVAIIKCKLVGPAYDVVKYDNDSMKEWADLKKTLQENFMELISSEQLQAELLQAQQRHSESVREFGTRIEHTLANLNDACIHQEGIEFAQTIKNINEKQALRAFVEGLKSPIKLVIKASRFKKLKEAIANAVEEEKTSAYYNNIHKTNNPSFGNNSNRNRSNNQYNQNRTNPSNWQNVSGTSQLNNMSRNVSGTSQFNNMNRNYQNNRNTSFPPRNNTSNSQNSNQGRQQNNPGNWQNIRNTSASSNQTNGNSSNNMGDWRNSTMIGQERPRNVFCSYCKIKNHHITECRKKKFVDGQMGGPEQQGNAQGSVSQDMLQQVQNLSVAH
jgi:hypothetical protein